MTVAGIDTHYVKTGAGPCVLFLHGWGVGAEAYAPLLERLATRYTVIAPDLPGFGKTPEPPRVWGLEEYGAFVLAFIREAGEAPVFALGHSNGGRVLLYMAGKLGQSFAPRRMALLHPAGVKTRKKPQVYAKIYAYKLAKALLRPFPRAWESFTASRGSADYKNASPLMRGVLSKLLKSDVSGCLKHIAAPTLLIWGKGDTAVPRGAVLTMQRRIPDAGLVTLDGGHWAFLEQLALTERVLRSFFGEAEP
ncbi:MAG: alpha/beta hydrolase [Oscillospiraceae bacterium]|jgi:pimeloyl-ACP methyl ester carboxylesterase|nr:alpha/beta hydrolase [Oscillospiraceae bacterium]